MTTNPSEDHDDLGEYTAYPSIPAEELEKLRELRAPFITTDKDMIPHLSKEYAEALIEKYGHTELHSTVEDDMEDFGELPDPCTDPECGCRADFEDGDQ